MAGFLLTMIQCGLGLQCYECNSVENEDCDASWNETNIGDFDKFIITCKYEEQYCMQKTSNIFKEKHFL